MVIDFRVLIKCKNSFIIHVHHIIELYMLFEILFLLIDNFIKKNGTGNRAILASGKNKKVIHLCKDNLEAYSQNF